MGLVERAVELLESVEGTRPEAEHRGGLERVDQGVGTPRGPQLPEVAPVKSQPGVVERLNFPEAVEPSSRIEPAIAPSKPAEVRRNDHLFRIDRRHLKARNLISPDDDRTVNAECFRRIKRHVLAKAARSGTSAPANLVMVTSALPQEGKTYCSINLAISIALEMDRTVLLVDADVAKPSVPEMLGLDIRRGLLDLLSDRKIDLAEVLCKADVGKLTVLPAGNSHHRSTELLASEGMRSLLRELAERYHDRIIIFDSPPLLMASEASVLASQMGQIIVVVEAGKTPEGALKTALGRIDTGNVTGLLLNKGVDPGLRYGYGEYGYRGK